MLLQSDDPAAVLQRGQVDGAGGEEPRVGTPSPCTRSRATPPSG